jgi:small conductance mechanosensitive channel
MHLPIPLFLLQDADPQQAADAAQQAGDAAQQGAGGAASDPVGAVTDLLSDPSQVMGLFETYGIPAIKALVMLFIAYLIAGWAKRVTTGTLKKAKFDLTLTKFLSNLVRWTILILAIIAILGMFGFQTASFAAVIGGSALALGLAFQGSLSNMAAGVMLLVFRPYKVGDFINAGGVAGVVDEIELFTTTLDTPDNRRIIVPNSGIFGATIENVTHHATRRVDVNVGVSYGADIDTTREVLMKAASNIEGRLTDKEPVVYLTGLGASSVDWVIRIWANTGDFWPVKERLTRAAKYALDEADISIPFPQMDVHLFKEN